MAQSTVNMGLRQWNLATDYFESPNLSDNWAKVDLHDHTSGKGVQIPTAGLQNHAVTSVKIAAGAVTTTEIQDATILLGDLASTVSNHFLKLRTDADRHLAWGITDIQSVDFTGGFGGPGPFNCRIPHGLGVIPQIAWFNLDTGVSDAGGGDSGDMSRAVWQDTNQSAGAPWNSTYLFIRYAPANGSVNFPGVRCFWGAIY